MAAPFRQTFRCLQSVSRLSENPLTGHVVHQNLRQSFLKCERYHSHKKHTKFFAPKPNAGFKSAVSLVIGGSAALYICGKFYSSFFHNPVIAESDVRPDVKISRKVRTDTDHSGLKLTLFQFQTCPFCCKVRALLDYHGFSYDVVEVNSVTKKQLKWSEYSKVPLLVAQMPGGDEVILRDSTVIISVLESYLHDRSTSLAKLNSFFPCLEEKKGRKTIYDFPNKYFIMFQEQADLTTTTKQREEERKWRRWTDDNLVHMLSPNVYRTASEALQAFHYFSDVGQWEQNFSTVERQVVIYVGAAVMYVMGRILKKKYMLKDDVRESLYDSCNEWVKAVGKDRSFMGGDQPNLADLSVYGVLNSIEGCPAFQDTLDRTKIGPWFRRTKEAVEGHHGSHPLNSKTTPSTQPKEGKKK